MHSIKSISKRNKIKSIDTQSRADACIRRKGKSDYNLKSGCK